MILLWVSAQPPRVPTPVIKEPPQVEPTPKAKSPTPPATEPDTGTAVGEVVEEDEDFSYDDSDEDSDEEAAAIERGDLPADNNPLCNAPHTVEDLVGEWDRPYSREQACFPPGAFRVDKYWAPVNRIDNVYGDRNLICSCPPLEEYMEAAE